MLVANVSDVGVSIPISNALLQKNIRCKETLLFLLRDFLPRGFHR